MNCGRERKDENYVEQKKQAHLEKVLVIGKKSLTLEGNAEEGKKEKSNDFQRMKLLFEKVVEFIAN